MGNDVNTVLNMAKLLRLLEFMETALTVGIIAFTVFRILMSAKEIKE